MDYHWNWNIFWQLAPDAGGSYAFSLLNGLCWTLATALLAWLIALVLGVVIGTLRTTSMRVWSSFGQAWVEVFRNIPLLVQMFLWYFVIPELVPASIGDWVKQIPNAPFVTAVMCLGFFTSARVAEQVRAGILSLPRGQNMAGMALGFKPTQNYRYVLLPQALRIVIPPLGSEFLNVIKNSAVALTIGLMELTARARSMQEFSFQVFEAFTAATLIYLVLNLVVVVLMRAIEKRACIPSASAMAGASSGS